MAEDRFGTESLPFDVTSRSWDTLDAASCSLAAMRFALARSSAQWRVMTPAKRATRQQPKTIALLVPARFHAASSALDVLVAVDVVVVVVVDELVVVVELADVEVEVVVDEVEVEVELVSEDVVVDSLVEVDSSDVVVVLSAVVSEVDVFDSELSVVSRAWIHALSELSRISTTFLISSI